MKTFALALFLAGSACYAQQPGPTAPSQSQGQAQAQANPQKPITVPAGTQIALTLSSPITTKARKGDTVRAAVAFPVTVDNQVAVPVGTYVQGVIAELKTHSRSGPSVTMHFLSMIFANGYTVSIDATNSQAGAPTAPSGHGAPAPFVGSAPATGLGKFALAARAANPTPPTLTPPSMPGPPKGFIIGLAVSTAATAALLAIALTHRGHGPGGSVIFDTGWQFNMVLNQPLPVNLNAIPASQTN